MNITVEKLHKALLKKGHIVFEDDTKPYNLNIIGVRSADTTPNKFNDSLVVMWKHRGVWNIIEFQITTEAGLYYLNNPLNNKGTAILKEGQYRGMWAIGKHQGKYEALKQVGEATVVRDFDRDSELDYNSGVEETGLFGINCHRSSKSGKSVLVGRWSAGCQVHSDIEDYILFMNLCKMSAKQHGNSFTYTLINENDL